MRSAVEGRQRAGRGPKGWLWRRVWLVGGFVGLILGGYWGGVHAARRAQEFVPFEILFCVCTGWRSGRWGGGWLAAHASSRLVWCRYRWPGLVQSRFAARETVWCAGWVWRLQQLKAARVQNQDLASDRMCCLLLAGVDRGVGVVGWADFGVGLAVLRCSLLFGFHALLIRAGAAGRVAESLTARGPVKSIPGLGFWWFGAQPRRPGQPARPCWRW